MSNHNSLNCQKYLLTSMVSVHISLDFFIQIFFYYELNACVSPEFLLRTPILQSGNVWRRGHREVGRL